MRPSDLVLGGDALGDRFVVEREVAVGGMGRVYRGRDRHTESSVAIKIVADPEPQAVARFARESVILAEIEHPGVVDYVTHGYLPTGSLYLVMEWLEGETLAARLGGHRPPDPERTQAERPGSGSSRRGAEGQALAISEALALARRVGSTLAAVHKRGVIHRDIKPGNLILQGGDPARVKLVDFGLARGAAGEPVTRGGFSVGTPRYMAPEQAAGREVGPAADVWALGCVLYQCLTGRAPFSEADALAAQARAGSEDPPSVRELRPNVPRSLAAVVEAALSRDPAARPASGTELEEALAGAGAEIDDETVAEREGEGARGAVMLLEHRVRSILAAPGAGAPTATVREVAAAHGFEAVGGDGAPQILARTATEVPREEAARAARLALALWRRAPELSLAIATGPCSYGAGGGADFGALGERAGAEALAADAGAIRLDRATADLVEGRFDVVFDDRGAALAGERSAEEARTLLGRPSTWVGRRRELSLLRATFEDCADDGRARAVLVTGAAGMGKSRLHHEFLRELETAGRDARVLRGRGDSLSSGSPFVILAPAIRRTAGILDGEPLAARRDKLLARLGETVPRAELERVAALLGELAGVPFDDAASEPLRAARQSPMLAGRLMREAFIAWLSAECAARPVILALEDLHWGDQVSIDFLDAALDELEESPLMVLALARPEVHTAFPGLWERRPVDEVRLHPLSRRACEEIARDALGDDAGADVIADVAARSGGNAFYLEELVRHAASGREGELPESLLGMVQARLDALEVSARRVLRAASVFGDVFWEGGVRALVDTRVDGFDVGEWLAELARQELVTRRASSRLPGEREYEFRHTLVREAAYGTLGEADRASAHALAGAWLEGAGEGDPFVLASHFFRGGDRARAIEKYRSAADHALGAGDFAGAIERAERAIEVGAEAEVRGALRAVQAMAVSWLSRHGDAVARGAEAIAALPAGGREWFLAAGTTIASSARVGDRDIFDRVLAGAEEAPPARGAESAQVVCLCRAVFQLAQDGRMERADRILRRIAALESEDEGLGALTRAQIHDARGGRAFCVGDGGRAVVEMRAAVDCFERAGDTNNVLLGRASIAWVTSELGDLEGAEDMARENLEACQRLGVRIGEIVSETVLGAVLSRRPDRLDEARERLQAGVRAYLDAGNRTYAGWAHGFLAQCELARAAPETARAHAREAVDMVAARPGFRSWAQALLSRALLSLGDAAGARDAAEAAMEVFRAQGGIVGNAALPPLARAEALRAAGDGAAARGAIAEAAEYVRARAGDLEGTPWEACYLALPDPSRTLELAAAWLG